MKNDFLTLIRTRRSIRAYKPDAVPADVLARVLEAGTYAPSAMGEQSATIVAVETKAYRDRLTKLNAAVIGKDTDPYYGAPVIVVVLGDGGSANYMADGSCVLENLMLAAHAEGLGSVWVNREREIFDSPDGKALLRTWGLPETLRGGGDLRLHRACAELPLAQVALRVVGVQHVERALLRRAEIQADVVDRRKDEQVVRAHGLGQTGAGKVLVDDGVDTEIVPVRVARDRHTAAAAGDDDILIVEQVQDRAPLDDVHRLRRGDDTPPAAPGILAHMQGRVAVLHPLCRGRVVKRADGLCRRLKGGVVRVNDDLRDDRRHLPRHGLRAQRTAQPLLQMIADIALTHGRALRQRHGRDGGVRFRGGVERRLDHADLRTVAVADDDLVSLMDEPDERRAGGGHTRALLGGRIAERVAAERDDDPCHGVTCAAARAAAA